MRSEEKLDTIDSEGEKLTIKPAEEKGQEMPAQAEKKRRKCRDLLVELRNLTYLIQENHDLSMFSHSTV